MDSILKIKKDEEEGKGIDFKTFGNQPILQN